MRAILFPTLILFSAATVFSACQSRKANASAAAHANIASANSGDLRVAVRDDVGVYQYGPQQLTKPNTTLNKGDLVRVVRKGFGYTLVETAEGKRLGWVASEDLGAAPPERTPDQPAAVDNSIPIPAPVGMAPTEAPPQGTNENSAAGAPSPVQTPNNLDEQKPLPAVSPEKGSFPIIAP